MSQAAGLETGLVIEMRGEAGLEMRMNICSVTGKGHHLVAGHLLGLHKALPSLVPDISWVAGLSQLGNGCQVE